MRYTRLSSFGQVFVARVAIVAFDLVIRGLAEFTCRAVDFLREPSFVLLVWTWS